MQQKYFFCFESKVITAKFVLHSKYLRDLDAKHNATIF